MIEKQRTNDAFVIGTYKLVGGLVHALRIHDDPYRHEAPLTTVCGAFQRVHYASPFALPIEMDNLLDVSCKRCSRILEQKSLLRIKKDKSIKLLGTYKFSHYSPTHAVVKREPMPSDNPAVGIPPFKSLCSNYPNVYHPDGSLLGYSHSVMVSIITCRECLDIMKRKGLLLEKDFPKLYKTELQPQKKFFLVFYDGGTVDSIYGFDELLQDAHRFKPTINKILLIESYKEVFVEEVAVVADKDGNEITKKDI